VANNSEDYLLRTGPCHHPAQPEEPRGLTPGRTRLQTGGSTGAESDLAKPL